MECFNIESSPSIGNLAWALCQAQKEMTFAPKDSNNPFFKSKYADLASVWGCCKEPLTKYGLSVMQFPCGDSDTCGLITQLNWAALDGESEHEWIRCKFIMKPKDNSPQGFGSCLTYMRRYALSSVVGVIAGDDDDDGNSASSTTQGSKPQMPQVVRTKSAVTYEGTDEQKFMLMKLCKELGISSPTRMGEISAKLKIGNYYMEDVDVATIGKIAKEISNEK